MINRENRRGFSAQEFLSILSVITILMAIVIFLAIKQGNEQKYNVLKENAFILLNNAVLYNTVYNLDDNTVIFLKDFIDKELFSSFVNPFTNNTRCDDFESNVEIKNNSYYISVNCNNYVILNDDLKNDINIYKVSNWMKSDNVVLKDNVEQKTLYNYSKDGVKILSEYVDSKTFLWHFNKNENTNYQSVKQIQTNNKYLILSYDAYRTKELVKTLK